ncbi:laterally symmetric protein 2 [Aphelenchoides avenae]|nr:laterally symmetric protein 2 [Aphelenchus avenae]
MVASQCNSQEWDDAPDEVPWLDNEVERQFEIQDERHIHEDLLQDGQTGCSSLQGILRDDQENNPPEPSSSKGQKASEPVQCPTCQKWFVSPSGLKLHTVLHTGEKPFVCTVCGKSFAFQSNLFSHASVHDDNPATHECPYCGKKCRLKENLLKHFKVHFKDEAELKQAWREHFGAGNRRSGKRAAAAEVDDNAVVKPKKKKVYTAPRKANRKRLGLRLDEGSSEWVQKVAQDEQFSTLSVDAKIERLSDLLEDAVKKGMSVQAVLEQLKSPPFEQFDCSFCSKLFATRNDCLDHLSSAHSEALKAELFCHVCLRSFKDRATMALHESYHERVQLLIRDDEIKFCDPQLVLYKEPCHDEAEDEDDDDFLDAASQDGDFAPTLECYGKDHE